MLRAILASIVLTATVGAQVVINEVYYDYGDPLGGSGSDGGKVFVELYGPPGWNIGDMTIRATEGNTSSCGLPNSESFTFPFGALIPADGFVVVADTNGGVTDVANADFTDTDMDAENGGDGFQLLQADGVVIDSMAYGTINCALDANGDPMYEGTPCDDVYGGYSLERWPAGLDTGDNSTDFAWQGWPSPGTSTCPTRNSYSQFGTSISAGESVSFDLTAPCAAGQMYLLLMSITGATADPVLPVIVDPFTFIAIEFANVAPFIDTFGVMDGGGQATASIDFLGFESVWLGADLPVWASAVTFDSGTGAPVWTDEAKIEIEP